MLVTIDRDPPEAIRLALSQGIAGFNRDTIPDLEPNEAEMLWLSDRARNSGIGRQIIESAEAFAIENGCEKAFVETTSWQARPFYERNGYTLLATLEDRPKGHASHYLTKTLARPET